MSIESTAGEAATRTINGREFKVIDLNEGRTDREIRTEIDAARQEDIDHKLALYALKRDEYWEKIKADKEAGLAPTSGPIPVVDISRPSARHTPNASSQAKTTGEYQGSLGGGSPANPLRVPGVIYR